MDNKISVEAGSLNPKSGMISSHLHHIKLGVITRWLRTNVLWFCTAIGSVIESHNLSSIAREDVTTSAREMEEMNASRKAMHEISHDLIVG